MEVDGAPADAEELRGEERRPNRRGRVALWCALGAVIAGAVAVVALRDTSRTPAEDLARVREFVGAAGTGHFTGETRSESGQGDDEPGSTSIDIARIEGRFVLPDRMQFVEDAGDYHTEGILLGTHSYFRSGESDDELHKAPWVYEELPDPAENLDATTLAGLDQAGAAAVATASGLFGAFGTPFDLESLLGRLDGVRRVAPGVLEAQPLARDFLADDLVAAIEKEAAEIKKQFEADSDEFSPDDFDISFLDEPVMIRLVHAPDGRLDEMVITIEDGTGEDRSAETSTLRFSRWGEPVEIERPGLDDVDLTPGIDEEKLASAAFALLAPAAPPAGFVLSQAFVQDEDLDEHQCAGAQFWYEPADDENSFADGEFRFFNVNITPTSCPSADGGQRGGLSGSDGVASTVQIGGRQADLQTSTFGDSSVVHVRFTAGDVVVEASSSLPQDQVVAALSTLAPLDLAGQPVRRFQPPAAD